jgi:hypothetical protein
LTLHAAHTVRACGRHISIDQHFSSSKSLQHRDFIRRSKEGSHFVCASTDPADFKVATLFYRLVAIVDRAINNRNVLTSYPNTEPKIQSNRTATVCKRSCH